MYFCDISDGSTDAADDIETQKPPLTDQLNSSSDISDDEYFPMEMHDGLSNDGHNNAEVSYI